MANNSSNSRKKKMAIRGSGFSLVSEDVIEKVLSRLPALSFASASCVSKSWDKICLRILSRPKLASALSLNPCLHDAMKEVLDKVLSEPIVPHFVVACIGKQFSLEVTHRLLTERFGTRVPVITNAASGIIGLDAATDELKEVRWESSDDEDQKDESKSERDHLLNRGIVLVVGFVPGLKVDAIPLLRSKAVPRTSSSLVDKFLTDIRNFTVCMSDCTSPVGIILFGDQKIDIKPLLARMDSALDEETVIVGDASGCFLSRSVDNRHNNYGNKYWIDAVALVFAKDKHKPDDVGETRFHVTLSTGIMPFGPRVQAVCVIAKDVERSWLTARIDGQFDLLDGEELLTDINDQFDKNYSSGIYIGVVQQRKHHVGAEKTISSSSLAFYEVIRGEKQFFVINGVGIKPGDYFLFYHSDPGTASSSCGDAFRNLAILKSESKNKNSNNSVKKNVGVSSEEKEVFGGLVFSCYSRGDVFFPNIDSSPIHENFPGIPLAGVYCSGEIGRGSSSSICQEDDVENSARCCLHYHSSVYLVLTYVAPGSSAQVF